MLLDIRLPQHVKAPKDDFEDEELEKDTLGDILPVSELKEGLLGLDDDDDDLMKKATTSSDHSL